jgi:hypothetical protein
MSLELVNTLATFGTFVVIAATAIAAVVQLRHARSSNHIAALNEIRETVETPDFEEANHFVMSQLATKLQDPAFRYQFGKPAARTDEMRPFINKANAVGNFYEGMGVLARIRLVDRELIFQMWADTIRMSWENLAPLAAIHRQRAGDAVWESFEYLTVISQDRIAAHPKRTYPAGVRRIELKYPWLEADKHYVASLAPA